MTGIHQIRDDYVFTVGAGAGIGASRVPIGECRSVTLPNGPYTGLELKRALAEQHPDLREPIVRRELMVRFNVDPQRQEELMSVSLVSAADRDLRR